MFCEKYGICCGQTRRTVKMWIYQVQESATVETTPTGNTEPTQPGVLPASPLNTLEMTTEMKCFWNV